VLRWTPREFMAATVWEATEAYEGWAVSKGVKKPKKTGLTDEEARELMEWMSEEHGDA